MQWPKEKGQKDKHDLQNTTQKPYSQYMNSPCHNCFHLLPKSQIQKERKIIQTNSFIIFTCPNPVLLVPGFVQVGQHKNCIYTDNIKLKATELIIYMIFQERREREQQELESAKEIADEDFDGFP